MPDYSKCVIYRLCCKDLNIKELYIGSTCNFTRRKCGHKSRCHNENDPKYNCKVYKFIRDNGGWDNWDMILVEEYPCENKPQKIQRERYWYEELKADLNKECPGRDKKEWYKTNRDEVLVKCKKYNETRKEEIKKYSKEYYETNKEYLSEKRKEYYETHKEKINEEKKETITCECGSVFRKDAIRAHERTKKHLDFINKN
jgi:hypothetical protein